MFGFIIQYISQHNITIILHHNYYNLHYDIIYTIMVKSKKIYNCLPTIGVIKLINL